MRNKYVALLLSTTIPALCSFLVFSILVCSGSAADAASPREDYNKVQRDIRKQKKKLAEATRTERSVISELRMIESQLNDINGQMNSTKNQIRTLKGGIASLEADITTNSRSIESQKTRLRMRLRTLRRINSEKEVILMLLSGEDPSTILKISRSLSDISNRYNESIKNYREELGRLSAKKKKLNGLVNNLKAEEQELATLENSAKAKKKEKENLLAGVRKDKDTYQQMIQGLKENADRLSKIITESEKHEKPTARKKRAKTTQSAKEELPAESPFTHRKGHLSWPVSGKIAIKYGSQVDPLFNLPVFRSGIHIRAAVGTPVSAVYEGKVVYAADLKGYGKLVVISHGGGYHTLYGNLSKIFLENGAIIKEGEAIGEIGESTALGTSGLYFEIRYKGKPLDPQQWLIKSGG
jgi:septal ring factor EnvC (AmiA/AmiB activator)